MWPHAEKIEEEDGDLKSALCCSYYHLSIRELTYHIELSTWTAKQEPSFLRDETEQSVRQPRHVWSLDFDA